MATDQNELKALTAEVVSAYVAHNSVGKADLPDLISSIFTSLSGLGQTQEPEPVKLTPPVSVRKSVGEDYIVSMEDGRRYKSLKRHLAGKGLTPAEYRTKWSLPSDYPMVAPSYAKQRSELAKALGLGRKPAVAPAPAPVKGRQKVATPSKGVAPARRTRKAA